jgi:WD40 repeat protein
MFRGMMERIRISVAVAGILGLAAFLLNLALHAPTRGTIQRPDQPLRAQSAHVVSLADGASAGELRRIVVGSGPIYSLALSPDGKWIASGGADRTVRIWNADTGEQVHYLTGHDSAVTSVAFSPDGRQLASAGGLRRRGLFLWDVRTGQQSAPLQPCDGWVSAVRFSPDGKSLLAAVGMGSRGKGLVAWWDLATSKRRRGPDGRELAYPNNDGISSIAISPNRRWVLVANYAMRIWDTKSNRERKAFDDKRETPLFIRKAIFTRRGSAILAGGLDGVLGLWDVDTGTQIRQFSGHTQDICALAVSGDDRWAVSSGFDGTVRLWDLASGRELRRFAGHQGIVWAVDMSLGAPVLASAGEDGTIRLWSASEHPNHSRISAADGPEQSNTR